MDREIDIGDSWKAEWLDRTYMPLHCYMSIFWIVICFTIIGLAIKMIITSVKYRRALQKSKDVPGSDPAELYERLRKNSTTYVRGQFVASCIVMANVFILILADTFVCLTAISDDVVAEPEAWTWDLLPEVAVYVCYLLAIFLAMFFLVPLLQVLLVTRLLVPRLRRNSDRPLSYYVPQAQSPITAVAQFWTFMAFMTAAYWPPTSEFSLARYSLLQACLGSACVWLQASYTFNYCANLLEDLDDTAVRAIFYGKTAKLVLANKGSDDVLPRYQAVPQSNTPLLEKE